MPTDIGWYPNAHHHYCERENGAAEHILILNVDGVGWYEINGIRRSINPNEALLIPRDTPHIYGASDYLPWSIHWVHFIGGNADFFASQLPKDKYTLSVHPETTERLRQLFTECTSSVSTNFVLHHMIYASETLHHLLACLFFSNHAFSPMLQTSQFHRLDSTLIFLQKNVHRSLTLSELAEHAQLSIPHFSRLFKEQTGYTPIAFFIHLKLQEAGKLLLISRMTIREISYELGYEDPYYFSRLFKKVMGMSPTQFREQRPAQYLNEMSWPKEQPPLSS
jgi:AraC family transcriptional regulator, arabinose operon regulatory protein